MNISIFFGSILHAVASFVVATLISSGLAAAPTPIQVTANVQASTTTSYSDASSTDQTSAAIQTELPVQTIKPPSPKTQTTVVNSQIVSQPTAPPAPSQQSPSTNNVNIVSPPAQEAPVTLTIKPDTSGFRGTTAQAFYNISSDSQNEVDIQEMSFSLSKISASDQVLVVITDDTNQVVLTSSSANSTYNPQTEQLSVEAIFNKPLRIMSGYPTMFDIQVEPVGEPPLGQPSITIGSVGSSFILNAGRPVVLF